MPLIKQYGSLRVAQMINFLQMLNQMLDQAPSQFPGLT
jgi:hypothetical protein